MAAIAVKFRRALAMLLAILLAVMMLVVMAGTGVVHWLINGSQKGRL